MLCSEKQFLQVENNFLNDPSPACFCLFVFTGSEKLCCLFSNDFLASLLKTSCSLGLVINCHNLSHVISSSRGVDQSDLKGQFRQDSLTSASTVTAQMIIIIKHHSIDIICITFFYVKVYIKIKKENICIFPCLVLRELCDLLAQQTIMSACCMFAI